MPYIGNSQSAGTNTNNFKVLDDITSYTETFDGTSASIVNTTNNTIRFPKHRFYHGKRVTYNHGGGKINNYDGSSVIEPGAFKYKSPCPPNGKHTYEWVIKAYEGTKKVATAKSSLKYP